MDWMLEGLLQGTQFQKLYNRRIEDLRRKHNLRKVDIDILYFLFKSGEAAYLYCAGSGGPPLYAHSTDRSCSKDCRRNHRAS